MVGCLPAEPIVDPVPEPIEKPDVEGKVSVGLGVHLNGLPEGSDRALIGMQVDVRGANGYRPYAYGLFRGTVVPSVEMLAQNSYRVTASWVEQGSLVGVDGQGRVLAPFSDHAGQGVAIQEAFVYSSTVRMDKLTLGVAQMAELSGGWCYYVRAPLVRYAAQVVDIVPRSGGVVELLFERVTFGLRISADWLTQGRIEATIDGGTTWVLRPEERSVEIECTLSGHADRSDWSQEGYVDQFTARAVWILPDASRVALGSSSFVVKKGQRVEWGLQERK